MTRPLRQRFAEIGFQGNVADPIVIAHYHNPKTSEHWYATEYVPRARLFFGFVSRFDDRRDDWGFFRLDELQSYGGWFRSEVRRDPDSGEARISYYAPEALEKSQYGHQPW